MARTSNNGNNGAHMTGKQPTRTSHGGNQSRGGNYENAGGDSTGAMRTQMNAGTTSGQPDNSELSKFMNNGGGPEPHQGSNPGAQSDPGPKEVGFYDMASNHMGGDDGVQSTVERPSPMRMGGVDGSQPNPGQRGGQNTGTSGAQTTSYSSDEEYGAGSIPGVTGASTSPGGGGSMDSQTRNPVGFAASFDGASTETVHPGEVSQMNDFRRPGYTGDSGSEGFQGVYQSRAAQQLVDMREDEYPGSAGSGSGSNDEPRVADKAGEVADAVKDKAGGFFSRARDRVEDFLTVDLNNDGSIGGGSRSAVGSHNGGSRMDPQGFETREAAPRMDPQSFETREAAPRMEPQAFETQDTAPRMEPDSFETREAMPQAAATVPDSAGSDHARMTGAETGGSAETDDSFSVFYGGQGDPGESGESVTGKAGGTPRTEAKARELVDA